MLRFFAKFVLRRKRPFVIGVTGTQGKTLAVEAIAAVLRTQGSVQKTLQNVHTERGIYRSILGCTSRKAQKSFWCPFTATLAFLFGIRRYPFVLVVEMGAEEAGRIPRLIRLARPTIGVLTTFSSSGTLQNGKSEKIMREKASLVLDLPQEGWAIVNNDDPRVMELKAKIRSRIITFGLSAGADVRATEITTSQDIDADGIPQVRGTYCKLSYKGSVVPVFLPQAVGEQHVLAAAAAVAVGIARGLHLVDISSALKLSVPPGGRLRVLPGIKTTVLLDDTYNGNAHATEYAIAALASVPVTPQNHRFAILGDMTDFSERSEDVHAHLGALLPEKKIHWLITVGEKARDIDRGARKAGMDDAMIVHFQTAEEAGRFAQEKMKKGDVLLIKGDPRLHMERIVKEIMAEPLKACDFLVRQDDDWECR